MKYNLLHSQFLLIFIIYPFPVKEHIPKTMHVRSTARHAIHLQFDNSANALGIGAV
jgi:hypothetical protein